MLQIQCFYLQNGEKVIESIFSEVIKCTQHNFQLVLSKLNTVQFLRFTSEIKALLDLLGVYEIAPHTEFFTILGHWLCNNEIHPIITEMCVDIVWWITNMDEEGKFNE